MARILAASRQDAMTASGRPHHTVLYIPTYQFKNKIHIGKLRAMEVTLNIPALIAESAEISSDDIDHLSLPGFQSIFSRAARQQYESFPYEEWLFQQFTGSRCKLNQLPVASLTAAVDGLDSSTGWWMRADPVYLHPDTHSLILQDPKGLSLTMAERDELADNVRSLFADYGASFHTPSTSRWYLHFAEQPPAVTCTPLFEAIMQPVNDLLPEGAERRRWHTLFNELQMVLNQSMVNENRSYYGQQLVNSLWFWGLGQKPQTTSPAYGCCIGGGDYVQALCRHTSNRHRHLADGITVSRYQDNALIVDERLLSAHRVRQPGQWLTALADVEREIMQPLWQGLKRGDISRLRLLTDDGSLYAISPSQARAFWKRLRPLSSFLLT